MADSLSRLLIKCASVLEMHGQNQFEEHLDSLISKKSISSKSEENIEFVVKIESRKDFIQINSIVEAVAQELSITPKQLAAGNGEIPSFALALTYTLVKKHLSISQKEIAKYFGRCDHTTVSKKISAIKKLNPNNRIDKNNYDLATKIDFIVSELLNQKNTKNG